MSRTELVSFRLTPSVKARLEAATTRCGLTIAEVCRTQVVSWLLEHEDETARARTVTDDSQRAAG